jgi:hypothetical protein
MIMRKRGSCVCEHIFCVVLSLQRTVYSRDTTDSLWICIALVCRRQEQKQMMR